MSKNEELKMSHRRSQHEETGHQSKVASELTWTFCGSAAWHYRIAPSIRRTISRFDSLSWLLHISTAFLRIITNCKLRMWRLESLDSKFSWRRNSTELRSFPHTSGRRRTFGESVRISCTIYQYGSCCQYGVESG